LNSLAAQERAWQERNERKVRGFKRGARDVQIMGDGISFMHSIVGVEKLEETRCCCSHACAHGWLGLAESFIFYFIFLYFLFYFSALILATRMSQIKFAKFMDT
jgi:hypothetical protein